MKKVITNNEIETFNFGLELGKSCRGGEVFALNGNLGAGKTKLVQGLAAGLGVKVTVNSPTFNILKLYPASGVVKRFCHIDTYRLDGVSDLANLGVEEIMDPETVTAIEWADKVKKILPAGARTITIETISENQRAITIS